VDGDGDVLATGVGSGDDSRAAETGAMLCATPDAAVDGDGDVLATGVGSCGSTAAAVAEEEVALELFNSSYQNQ
jgi:hypothetical protein